MATIDPTGDKPAVYTLAETAEILRVSYDVVRKNIYNGQWPHTRISERRRVVTHDDLEAIFALLHHTPKPATTRTARRQQREHVHALLKVVA